VHSSTKSLSSSEETGVIPDDGLFNRKVEEEKIKEQSSPNPISNLAPVAQGFREETRCCTTRDQRRDAVERIGCDNTISRRPVRIYHGVAISKHHRIFRLLGERWHGVEVHRGRTLYEVIRPRSTLTRAQKIDLHNQLLDGITHLHSFALSHGDLSLLNIQVTRSSDTIKLLEFGRSVSIDSISVSTSDKPVDPFQSPARNGSSTAPPKKVEQIHPGTRPFAAPEVLRGECQEPLLADTYSFGVILVVIDRVEVMNLKPWEQRKDVVPDSLCRMRGV